ncbi:bifunctional diaminohydroxyphosphoribosylaminopyrimidine deaminase/5-amino-6-(5-phosphoribosylamino)uracil reductase RibD [Photobacterium sp. 1_MG-2023]|uniref:bifunctional diaminohydroxyphosphoribosylaminopyrimidine deaminase/5-amino-6-(5-phosphoribosylamino)uracil reductase RibD n=1 Tax=Photobacterium sp. 1_MG-2023 TaxID=3062646 RepID=UPI0026E2938E|nr:bifunctional diaminohydroxyphosphoribosylaminopyrimidine deaminase/5-amino-6-(5-phosphoribosylamino)uracil reductase RibD [Photobacterium sp. 1_MG-2023]MDO6704612.1 bifunctional diaminohydroxyphosphoribosylaminopyrimidine deaminase/5-amino-6-(5-phosphoribosylamino)uracil reductase RibD [Photobacterium sp. 1_MG-2023]
MFTPTDHAMMRRALSLAKRGRFTTAPNPNVGCVIAKHDTILGEGFHYRAGQPHAEVFALRAAGDQAAGATAYVTLEPCSHYGRTPPCAEALIQAGVARVVCAMVDPNPKVAGRGVEMLKSAGIQVETGLLEADALALNPGFICRMKIGRPYVQLKLAASLDGKTALANGVSQWITGPQARADVQRFRAQAGAILSTSATVLADDPSLNVRWEELGESVQAEYPLSELRQPVRVIIDSQNRLSPSQRLFSLPGRIILARAKADAQRWPSHVEQLEIPLDEQGQLDLSALMHALAQQDINHLWVEAGASLAGGLINAGLVDELLLYQAPKLMGSGSRSLIDLQAMTAMSQVPELVLNDVRQVGQDIRIRATIAPAATKES